MAEQTFRDRLHELKRTTDCKQTDIAAALNVSSSAVSQWFDLRSPRNAAISPENAVKLAQFFNVDPGWLMFGLDSKQAKLAYENRRLKAENDRLHNLVANIQGLISELVESK